MTILSFAGCGRPSASIALGLVLAGVCAALVWRGGTGARAVTPGLAAGVISLAVPILACPACRALNLAEAAPWVVCAVGGLCSGAVIAFATAGERRDRALLVFGAGAVAALAGSLGCVIAGLGGVAAMMAALALATPLSFRFAR